jgi:hypothetical protein
VPSLRAACASVPTASIPHPPRSRVKLPDVAPRSRVLAYGTAAAAVIAGVICLALIGGVVGDALAIALMLAGFGGALLLLFYEVGLSEERERARKRARDEE